MQDIRFQILDFEQFRVQQKTTAQASMKLLFFFLLFYSICLETHYAFVQFVSSSQRRLSGSKRQGIVVSDDGHLYDVLSSSSEHLYPVGLGSLPPSPSTPFEFTSTITTSSIETQDILVVVGVFVLGAISAFVVANVMYTPEIGEAKEELHFQNRQFQVEQLLNALEETLERVGEEKEKAAIEKLRESLEASLDMPLDDYVRAVQDDVGVTPGEEGGRRQFCAADVKLATILAPFCDEV